VTPKVVVFEHVLTPSGGVLAGHKENTPGFSPRTCSKSGRKRMRKVAETLFFMVSAVYPSGKGNFCMHLSKNPSKTAQKRPKTHRF